MSRPDEAAVNASAGAAAGAISRLAAAPFDLLKIRFQLQPYGTCQYSSVSQAAREIIATEGVRGLWKGTVSATMLWSLYGSVQFGVYSKLRGEGGGDSGGSRDDVQEGGSSGGIGMLTSSSSSTTSNSTTSSITTATGRARQWLWDGFAGAVSCATATVVSYPLDIARTQFSIQGVVRVHTSLGSFFRDTIQNAGIAGLYRGVGASLAGTVPYMGINFAFYELFKSIGAGLMARTSSSTSTTISNRSSSGNTNTTPPPVPVPAAPVPVVAIAPPVIPATPSSPSASASSASTLATAGVSESEKGKTGVNGTGPTTTITSPSTAVTTPAASVVTPLGRHRAATTSGRVYHHPDTGNNTSSSNINNSNSNSSGSDTSTSDGSALPSPPASATPSPDTSTSTTSATPPPTTTTTTTTTTTARKRNGDDVEIDFSAPDFLPRNSVWADIAQVASAGALSGGLSKLIMYPMDTIKRKFQSQVLMNTFDRYSPYNLGVGKYGTDLEQYVSIRHCARVIVQREGVQGFYKGLVPAMWKAVASTALTFTVYEVIKTSALRIVEPTV